MGLIEQCGSGIQRMIAACVEAGLPAPVLEEIGTHFRVTLSTIPTGPIRLDEKDDAILRVLADGPRPLDGSDCKGRLTLAAGGQDRLANLVRRGLRD
jgi:hypothetical protein